MDSSDTEDVNSTVSSSPSPSSSSAHSSSEPPPPFDDAPAVGRRYEGSVDASGQDEEDDSSSSSSVSPEVTIKAPSVTFERAPKKSREKKRKDRTMSFSKDRLFTHLSSKYGDVMSDSEKRRRLHIKFEIPHVILTLLHLAYIISLGLVGALVFCLADGLDVTDGIFMGMSASTVTGLATIPPEDLSDGSLVVMGLVLFFGGQVFTTFLLILVKRRHVYQKIKAAKDEEDELYYTTEYKALTLLTIVVPVVTGAVFALTFISLWIYLAVYTKDTPELIDDKPPIAVALFWTTSAFVNGGLSVISSLAPFLTSFVVNFFFSFALLIGNTMFPSYLMFCIWLGKKYNVGGKGVLFAYLMENPRWCFALFPVPQTKAFLYTSILVHIPHVVIFLVMEVYNPVMKALTGAQFFMAAVFNSISSRTAGISFFDHGTMQSSTIMVTVLLMYLKSWPVIGEKTEEGHAKGTGFVTKTLISMNTKNMLVNSAMWVFIALLTIMCVEKFHGTWDNDRSLTVLYEVFSAFGTVGYSLGAPGYSVSYSVTLTDVSKFVIILTMLMGRHRGLDAGLKDMEDEEVEREYGKYLAQRVESIKEVVELEDNIRNALVSLDSSASMIDASIEGQDKKET